MASQTDQPRPPSSQPQQTTQLEFYQAMNDFKTMFPEMDEDVIEAVLRSNNGAVDVTIDQLLAMSTDNENEKIRTNQPEKTEQSNTPEPPTYSPGTPPPPYRQVMYTSFNSPSNQRCSSITGVKSNNISSSPKSSDELMTSFESPNTTEPVPLRILKNWKPPLLGPLPESFLRVSSSHSKHRQRKVVLSTEILKQKMQENARLRRMDSSDDPELVRYLEDERVALLLQNEEFVTELRHNKDFMSTLEKDNTDRSLPLNSSQNAEGESSPVLPKLGSVPEEASLDAFPFTKTLPHDPESDAAFKEKLRNMGKMSRKKFTQLAKMFSRRKKRKGILGDKSAISQDNLLLDEEDISDDSAHDSDGEDGMTPLFEHVPETQTVDSRGRSHSSLHSSRHSGNKYNMI